MYLSQFFDSEEDSLEKCESPTKTLVSPIGDRAVKGNMSNHIKSA